MVISTTRQEFASRPRGRKEETGASAVNLKGISFKSGSRQTAGNTPSSKDKPSNAGSDMDIYPQKKQKRRKKDQPLKEYASSDKFVLREIDDYGLLDKKTERELLIRAKADPPDQKALKALFLCNKKLFAKFAFLYSGRGCDLADLMQEAALGFLTAINNFDLKRDYRLSTYAYFCIRTFVQRAVLYKGKMIRITPKEKKDAPKRRVFDAIEHFYSDIQEVLLEEGVFDCSAGQREKLKPFNLDYHPIHMSLSNDPENIPIEEKIPSGYTDIEYTAEVNEDYSYLNQVIDTYLTPEDRDFIRKRWGLYDTIVRTKFEMARIFRITPEEAEAREQKITQTLYKNMDASRLNGDYVDKRTSKRIEDSKSS